uniref:Phosphoinositide phospholipase C n=1 Tax=Pyrodinium bahamense TaxID=73915 RepID=A0A7S0AEC7_9DINO
MAVGAHTEDVSLTSDNRAEGPEEDELEFYEQLERRGWNCGVHDPDFASPLDGTVYLERGLRYMLRLECEDESLNVDARKISEIRLEFRDNVGGGCGVALIDTSGSSGSSVTANGNNIRILITRSEEERELLVRVIERLRDDPRSFRRARRTSFLGCFPSGCASGFAPAIGRPLSRRARSRPASAPPSGLPGTAAATSAPPSAGRGRASSSSSSSKRSGPAAPTLAPALNEVQVQVRRLWEAALRRSAGTRSSSFGALSIANMRRAGARSSERPEGEPKAKALAISPIVKASDQLDTLSSAVLLRRLLCTEEGEAAAGVVDIFSRRDQGHGVSFSEFWDILVSMLLASTLWLEPVLQKRLHEGGVAGMTLEKWRWFLVQVQDEERSVVEAAEVQLSEMVSPDVDDDGRMTLLGLSRYLCSPGNSAFKPRRCEVYQNMSRPLTEYWIASAHHIYSDPPKAVPSEGTLVCSSLEGANALLATLHAPLRSGCRCMTFALVAGSSQNGGGLSVLLQCERVPLADVLRLIDRRGFEMTSFPMLLVLRLGLLPPASCKEVPGMLSEILGRRLWRNTGAGVPSPAEARDHVVVILAPAAPDGDPPLDAELQQESQGVPATAEETCGGTFDPANILQAWQDASNNFAVWPGQNFRRHFLEKARRDTMVCFLPCDELRSLAEAKRELVVEYHQQHLTLAYPTAPRCAPANFNAAGAWAAGVQMAALTFHSGSGDSAALAHVGRFWQENGGCGYVLKPPHLCQVKECPEVAEAPVRLELRVLAARAVPGVDGQAAPEGPTLVAVSVWGMAADCARKAYRPVRPSGPVITWPEAEITSDGSAPKPMDFSVISSSTAVIVVELLELEPQAGSLRRLGFFASPVDGLRQGLRWVPLWTQGVGGEVQPTRHGSLAGLLVHLAILRGKERAVRRRG